MSAFERFSAYSWKCPDVSELNVPAATSPAAPPARILETLIFEHIFYSGNLAENIEMHLSGKQRWSEWKPRLFDPFPLGGKILLLSHEINKSSIYLLALSGAVSSLLSPVKFYSYIQRFSPKLSDVFAFQHNVRLDERQHCLSYCSIFVIYLTSLRSTKTFMTARGIMRLCGVMDF